MFKKFGLILAAAMLMFSMAACQSEGGEDEVSAQGITDTEV